jgi:hypothetical protein
VTFCVLDSTRIAARAESTLPFSTVSIGRDASEMLAKNQRVNVMRSLVRLHRFQIHHVTHDWVLIGDAVRTEEVAGPAGALSSYRSHRANSL